LQPLGQTSFALQASLVASSGFHASAVWNSTYPKNYMGVSTKGVSAWTAYVTGAKGDTGRVVLEQLPNYSALSSNLFPTGDCPSRSLNFYQVDHHHHQGRVQDFCCLPNTASYFKQS
jgi:hypothetical protein